MKVVNYEFDSDMPRMNLYPIGDLHLGDANCNEKAVLKLFHTLNQDEHGYAILNGDLVNNATTTSVSDSYAEKLTPDEEIDYICALIHPIRHKVLFCTTGNHEFRTWKSSGIDIMGRAMKELGIYDRYCPEGGVGFIRFGRETNHGRKVRYSFYATHGSGGGKKEGGKLNRLVELSSIVDTDIYIHSHTHMPAVVKNDYVRVDNCNSTIAQVTKLFVNTSAQLNYGGYGQKMGMKPSCRDNPVILLDGTKKEMRSIL